MADIKKRGLESLLAGALLWIRYSEEQRQNARTIGFKATEKEYETYNRYSKYFGTDELIRKWRADLDKIEQRKGKDMEGVETEFRKLLTK